MRLLLLSLPLFLAACTGKPSFEDPALSDRELNLEEFCHGNVKHHLANLVPADKTALRQNLDRGFARLRRRPDLLLSFIQAAQLPVR